MSDWLFTDKPIPKHQCGNADCLSSDVRFLFNENNGSVNRVCFGCWSAKAVKKSDWLKEVTGKYEEFTLARAAWLKAKWEASKLEQDTKAGQIEEFYNTREWERLRYDVLRDHFVKFGHWCLCCKNKFVELHVDHIKPRSKYPHLALDKTNLQVLCAKCNRGKSNRDETDFREGA